MNKWMSLFLVSLLNMTMTEAYGSAKSLISGLRIDTSLADYGIKSSIKIKKLRVQPFGVYQNRLLVIASIPETFKLYDTGLKQLVFYRSLDGTDGVKEKGEFYPIAGIDHFGKISGHKGTILKHMDPTNFKHSLKHVLGKAYDRKTSELFTQFLIPSFKGCYDFYLNKEIYSMSLKIKNLLKKYSGLDADTLHRTRRLALRRLNPRVINQTIREHFRDRELFDCTFDHKRGLWFFFDKKRRKVYLAD